MEAMSASKFRDAMSVTIDQLEQDQTALIVTRPNGRPSAVVLPQSYFDSLAETAYLFGNPANAARLLESFAQLDKGMGEAHELDES